MKKISFWANEHVVIARLLVILLKIVLAAMAYYTGLALVKIQVILPSGIINVTTFLVLLLVVSLYPTRNKSAFSGNRRYLVQKSCDFVLGLLSFMAIATWVNNGDRVEGRSQANALTIMRHAPTAKEVLNSLNTRERESLTRKEKRILRKEFYRQLKIYGAAKAAGEKEKSGEAWKIILVILGAVGLLFLLAGLVCSISCGGSDAAAIVVAVLGVAVIIWGAVALIKLIERGPKKSE